jgi:hypothetical protein
MIHLALGYYHVVLTGLQFALAWIKSYDILMMPPNTSLASNAAGRFGFAESI